jgi:hypothetical protein
MNSYKENIIIWEKWQDPFGDNIEEEPNDGLGNFFEDEIESDLEQSLINKINPKPVKVISTPMGIVPLNEHTSSSKIFNFWTGHTNFDITKNIALLLDNIEGIETLDIFTRYRFRIGIGKAFTDSAVMNSIQNVIYDYLEQSESDEKIQN